MNEQERPQRPGWYVVQVTGGSEERMCRKIERACVELDATNTDGARVGLKECFSPRYASRKKRMGRWYDVERPLMPGYVVADVLDPAMLARALGSLNAYCRVLTSGKAYCPLDDAERQWIQGQTSAGNRTVPLSLGYKEGEKLVITDGPLKGREALITKIDRKNSLAHLELHAGQMTIKAKVGLVILPGGKTLQVG